MKASAGLLQLCACSLPLPLVITSTAKNPFRAKQQLLREQFYSTQDSGYDFQLYALSEVYAFSLACVVVAIAVRLKNRTLWLMRVTATSSGTWLAPHQVGCWLVFSGIFLVGELFVDCDSCG